jgi:hypothetical protein
LDTENNNQLMSTNESREITSKTANTRANLVNANILLSSIHIQRTPQFTIQNLSIHVGKSKYDVKCPYIIAENVKNASSKTYV